MSQVESTEHLLLSILLQLVVMIGAARLMNAAFRRMGQPGVIGEIVAGLLLGPSFFAHFWPGAFAALFGRTPSQPLIVLSQLGLILLMFQIGCDFEFAHLAERRYRRAALGVAAVSIAVPFALGCGFGEISAQSLAPGIDPRVYSLFCGVALAITAVPILGRILHEFALDRTPVGVVAITAAAVNDVVGWVLLAFVSAYATHRFSGGFVGLKLLEIVGFSLLLALVLRPAADRLVIAMPLRGGMLPPNLMAIVICLTLALGICTYLIGIFAIFGGFAAGLLFYRHLDFVAAWRRQVGQFVLVFFLPVFFTFTGLRTNLLGLGAGDLVWLAAVLAAAMLGKIVPVYLAGRATGFTGPESHVLGWLMNTRALMELIVLNIGYDLGFLPQKTFTMLVVMAVATTMTAGPMLHLLLPRIGWSPAARREA